MFIQLRQFGSAFDHPRLSNKGMTWDDPTLICHSKCFSVVFLNGDHCIWFVIVTPSLGRLSSHHLRRHLRRFSSFRTTMFFLRNDGRPPEVGEGGRDGSRQSWFGQLWSTKGRCFSFRSGKECEFSGLALLLFSHHHFVQFGSLQMKIFGNTPVVWEKIT